MNDQNITKNVTIKTEPTSKKIVISNSLLPPSAIKKEPSARLPSFKPPRDLLLTGSTTHVSSSNLKDFISTGNKVNKRRYTPNVNIFRKKASNTQQTNEPATTESDTKSRNSDQPKRGASINKKRNSNYIQTKGVFSEGLASGKVKAFTSSYSERCSSESNILNKPKLVLNQKINKSNEDVKLRNILKDDFIDDPSNMPDLNFIPKSLPIIYNEKKFYGSSDIEKTFQNLQVKIEKANIVKTDNVKDDKSEIFGAFTESDTPKILMFEFPKITDNTEDANKKKTSKVQSNSETDNKIKLSNLSSNGEGHWGYLRIHESGNAYFVVGTNVIPISLSRHLARQEVMSTSIDHTQCKAQLINLGTIDANFTCSTNFDG